MFLASGVHRVYSPNRAMVSLVWYLGNYMVCAVIRKGKGQVHGRVYEKSFISWASTQRGLALRTVPPLLAWHSVCRWDGLSH